ncbi:gamma carbonic anhydrase family protein [Aquabacterium sp.]|uniref:gamma carbonic anhydrase family protein n=1 Tax=Aquabacterium sp. TaxID=1872578 RepID=UPI0035AD99CA
MPLYEIDNQRPAVHATAYVADSADLIGAVELAEGSSVWSHVAIRGDNEPIRIGVNSNVQEGCVLHTDLGSPLTIGANVTVGHQAMLHGCTVGDGALIGIQAVVLNGAKIGKNCLVGAGALVTEGKEFADGMLILGSPAKAIRPLTDLEISRMHLGTASYVVRAQAFKTSLKRVG